MASYCCSNAFIDRGNKYECYGCGEAQPYPTGLPRSCWPDYADSQPIVESWLYLLLDPLTATLLAATVRDKLRDVMREFTAYYDRDGEQETTWDEMSEAANRYRYDFTV